MIKRFEIGLVTWLVLKRFRRAYPDKKFRINKSRSTKSRYIQCKSRSGYKNVMRISDHLPLTSHAKHPCEYMSPQQYRTGRRWGIVI